ncbi:hypothetical protein GQS65_00155 [Halomarina oriensis]|uniref:Uncharacterized protein n=2 Tax=Halomarina oriensis TaxID=671145 RepID=A0A6B0GHM5_9EURY|nr:hypothetical protein [Halomarina oriensis]
MDEYRVLTSPRADDERLLLDPDTADPTYVPAASLDGVEPGNRIRATLDWTGDEPRVTDHELVEATRFHFRRDATPLFEAAADCWQETVTSGEAMGSRLLRNTDSDPVGVVYVFAEQAGARDLFGEFAGGTKPLDPLLDGVTADPPHEVFVLDPADHRCVVVCVAFDPDRRFAETMRDTYRRV